MLFYALNKIYHMAQHREWIPLEDCVNFYLDESEQSIHKYYKCWNLAIRAMDELGLDFFYQVKSVKLPVNPNFTVDLPADFLHYTKVGILNSKGEIVPLIYNQKLTYFADQSPDRLEKTQDNSLWTWYDYNNIIFYNYWDGQIYTNLYGIPSGAPFIGNFKIDRDNGVILLDERFCFPYVMLEYIASPQQNQQYYVPVQFREAVISYLRWKDIISLPITRKGTLGDKQQRRHEFFNDRRLAIARWKPIELEDGYNTNIQNTRLVVKS